MLFKNRFAAGEQLAGKLKNYKDSIILAIPRGGLEIALPIAKKINGTVEIIVARKIATPQDPEVAVGAITSDGTAVLNSAHVEMLGLSEEEISIMKKEARAEAVRRQHIYGLGKVKARNKTVIIVDDGLATGYTMLAAIKSVKKSKPKKVVVAVPVASRDSYETVKRECDEMICLHISESWAFSVGGFYEEFHQLTDEEVVELLKKANKRA